MGRRMAPGRCLALQIKTATLFSEHAARIPCVWAMALWSKIRTPMSSIGTETDSNPSRSTTICRFFRESRAGLLISMIRLIIARCNVA